MSSGVVVLALVTLVLVVVFVIVVIIVNLCAGLGGVVGVWSGIVWLAGLILV